jgi:hypothetical protein
MIQWKGSYKHAAEPQDMLCRNNTLALEQQKKYSADPGYIDQGLEHVLSGF